MMNTAAGKVREQMTTSEKFKMKIDIENFKLIHRIDAGALTTIIAEATIHERSGHPLRWRRETHHNVRIWKPGNSTDWFIMTSNRKLPAARVEEAIRAAAQFGADKEKHCEGTV